MDIWNQKIFIDFSFVILYMHFCVQFLFEIFYKHLIYDILKQ